MRDIATIGLIVALFALAGWLLPRCTLEATRPVATTSTTDYRSAQCVTFRNGACSLPGSIDQQASAHPGVDPRGSLDVRTARSRTR